MPNTNNVKVKDIYDYINDIAPYSLQESYDNSGINVCFKEKNVENVMLALDITNEIIDEAKEKNVQLILTHHPVIFKALKNLSDSDIAVKLCLNGISAVSAHTNFDSAKMNDILCEKLGLKQVSPLAVENGTPLGCICETEEITAKQLAERIKSALDNTVIRYNSIDKKIKRIAVCSGSGGSFLRNCLAENCDAFITGDVKHDIFIDAHNAGLCVFDAGHFHTENIFCEYMEKVLSERFPGVNFFTADSNKDILSYEF